MFKKGSYEPLSNHLSITSLHATFHSICLTSLNDNLLRASTLIHSHPYIFKHLSKSCFYRTPFYNSLTSIITCFSNLSTPILITSNQNSMHLLIPSHFNGKMFSSKWRDTLGCSLNSHKKPCSSKLYPLQWCQLPTPTHTSAPYNNAKSTNISNSFKNVLPLMPRSPTVTLHLLNQSLRALALAFALFSAILEQLSCIYHIQYK